MSNEGSLLDEAWTERLANVDETKSEKGRGKLDWELAAVLRVQSLFSPACSLLT